MREGAPTRRSGDLGFGDNEHDSLHCHLENSGSGKNVEFAEVHHKDFAGHLRSIALEDFVEEGNCFADMEVNIHSHLLTISSWREAVFVGPTLVAHDIAADGLPIHHDPD